MLVHRIARGEFADQYPAATARLTIHLGNITKEADRWMWHSYQEFFDDLEEVEDLKLVGPSATDSLAYRAGKQITLLGIAVFLLDYYSYEESEKPCVPTNRRRGWPW